MGTQLRRISILFFSISLLIAFTNCQKKDTGGEFGGGLEEAPPTGGGSTSFDPNGNYDPAAGLDEMDNALGQIQPENGEEASAINSARDTVSAFKNAWGQYQPNGMSNSQIQQFLQAYAEAQRKAQETAQLLQNIERLRFLAWAYWAFAVKWPVLEYYKASTKKFFYTTSRAEANQNAVPGGYAFRRIAFNVCNTSNPTVAHRAQEMGCTADLYRCYFAQDDDHFLSRRSNCEGKTVEGVIGKIFPKKKTGVADLKEVRFYHKKNKTHFHTINPTTITKLRKDRANWRYEGVQGFPIN